MREVEEDLLQDLQWNGEQLKRREELRNHLGLQTRKPRLCKGGQPERPDQRAGPPGS